MDKNTLYERFYELGTDLERSLRYYAAMRARCTLWAFAVQALCVLSASSVFVAVVGGASRTAMTALSFLAAVCTSLSLAERASDRAEWYLRKRKSFSELKGRIPLDEESYTVATLEDLTRERLALEADEPPLYGCLAVICHNEVCEAVGRLDCKHGLTCAQRWFWRFLPVPYKTPEEDGKKGGGGAEASASFAPRPGPPPTDKDHA